LLENLSRWEGAGINDLFGLLDELLVGAVQGRAWKGHETGAGGLEDTEWSNELHERVDTGRLS
jgi:hypothetical protein